MQNVVTYGQALMLRGAGFPQQNTEWAYLEFVGRSLLVPAYTMEPPLLAAPSVLELMLAIQPFAINYQKLDKDFINYLVERYMETRK